MENPAIVYLYLYLAIADKEFSEKEASIILSKLKKNPAFAGMDTGCFVDDIYQNFLRLPFDNVMVYLENYMMEVKLTETERTSVINDLEEIMEADGVIRKEEMMAFQRIKKYLAINNNYQYRASA
ncbi:MAG TPA: hypothetical protein PLK63_14290 [Catalimonadaceae bacterium]|nr:hypothetical protein [Catalimonadaceae bacterium]